MALQDPTPGSEPFVPHQESLDLIRLMLPDNVGLQDAAVMQDEKVSSFKLAAISQAHCRPGFDCFSKRLTATSSTCLPSLLVRTRLNSKM